MELKKTRPAPLVLSTLPSAPALAIAIAPDEAIQQDGLPYQAIWNSFFATMLLSLLGVTLPFLVIAGLVPNLLSPFGVGPQVVAIAILIGVTALTARLIIRPVLELLSRAAARAESGDFTVRVIPSGSNEIRALGHGFNSMLQRLAAIQFRIRNEVVDSAGHLAQAARELADATLEQTIAASQTSASMEELARSTISIAESAGGVTSQVADVRARIGSAQLELVTSVERVQSLSHRVGEIEGILTLINDIADETNLLALNAAIEAARAGESGRGFAVVADEVRRLAERSKTAAAQIGTLVGDAQMQARATVTAVEERRRQMELWLSMMVKMADASARVELATADQRSAVDEAVEAIEQIAVGSRTVSQTAQEIAIAAARQGEIATELASAPREGGEADHGE